MEELEIIQYQRLIHFQASQNHKDPQVGTRISHLLILPHLNRHQSRKRKISSVPYQTIKPPSNQPLPLITGRLLVLNCRLQLKIILLPILTSISQRVTWPNSMKTHSPNLPTVSLRTIRSSRVMPTLFQSTLLARGRARSLGSKTLLPHSISPCSNKPITRTITIRLE